MAERGRPRQPLSITDDDRVVLVVRRGFGFGECGAASADFGDDLVGCLGPDERFWSSL